MFSLEIGNRPLRNTQLQKYLRMIFSDRINLYNREQDPRGRRKEAMWSIQSKLKNPYLEL